MSTATYSTRDFAPAAPPAEKPKRKLFWQSLYEAIVASQQRRAEREVAAYLKRNGGLLTDEMEREIMHRLTGGRRGFTV